MHSNGTFLITGATGNVGLETTLTLLSEGRRVRALVRDAQRGKEKILSALEASPRHTTERETARQLLECRSFDFLHDTPQAELFDGVTGIFLMRPPNIGDVKRYMFPFLHAARDAHVKHIALLSLLGAQKIFFIPHRKLEKEILRLGFRYHFLRAGFFMQNLDTVFDRFIREENELPVPAGGGRTSFVDARDLGEAAARLLCDADGSSSGRYSNNEASGGSSTPGGSNTSGAPELTGSEALDYHQVAKMLSGELGRPIRYTAPGLHEFRRRVLSAGWDPDYAKIVGRLFYTVRFGMAARVSEELKEILGRPPRTMRQYIEDYRESWLPSPASSSHKATGA